MQFPTMTRSLPERSLRDFYYIIFRQRHKIILIFCTVMVVTGLITFLAPHIYRSEAELMVRLGRESVTLDPTVSTGQTVQVGLQRENEIKTELDILRSRSLAERVVESVGPETILAGQGYLGRFLSSEGKRGSGKAGSFSATKLNDERSRAIHDLSKNLTVENQKNSNIISLYYEANNQELAQLVLAKLLEFYLDIHINVYRTPGSDEFFQNQIRQLMGKMKKTEEALKDVKNKTGISSVNEQRTILLNRIGVVQSGIEETKIALAASEARVATMSGTLGKLPSALLRTKFAGYSGNPIDFLHQRLIELELKEKDLRTTMTEKNRLVEDVRKQIEDAQEMLRKQGATHGQIKQLALLSEKVTLAELRAKSTGLQQELLLAQDSLRQINGTETKIGQLEREMEIQRANYRNFSDKLEQTRIDRALELGRISNISIVQSASYPTKAVRPRKMVNLALGLSLGLIGGLGMACLAEYLDHTFKTPEAVNKKLQIPVLATIPKSEFSRSLHAFLTISKRAARDPVDEITQSFAALLTNFLHALNRTGPPSSLIAVTSCYAGEGVTSVAANLALALAHQTSGRLLLVDANLRDPAVAALCGVPESPGLAEVLDQGPTGLVSLQPGPLPNLSILPAGHGANNLSALVESGKFIDVLKAWRNQFAYVIFDAPPLQEDLGAVSLSRLMDGVILVVEAERTRWEVAQQATASLLRVQAPVLGAVLNKRQMPIPPWLYRTL